MYGHFVWVVNGLYLAMPDPAKEAVAKRAMRDAKRRKLSETTRRGIVALCIAPGLPNIANINVNEAVTDDDGKPVVATTNV